MKKILSLVLVLVMLAGVITAAPITVVAAEKEVVDTSATSPLVDFLGNNGQPNSIQGAYLIGNTNGSTQLIYEPRFYREGYTFVGWMNYGQKKNMSTALYNGLVNGTQTLPYDSSDVDLHLNDWFHIFLSSNTESNPHLLIACWEINKYKITYVLNNGQSNRSYTKTHDVDLNSIIPEKAGYTFLGWDTDSAAENVVIKAGAKITRNWDETLYAVWQKDIYTVNYHANGGEGAPPSQQTEVDDGKIISLDEPTRTGYTFEGWIENREKLTADYMPGDLLPNKNLELYALWKPVVSDNEAIVTGIYESDADNVIFEDIYVSIPDNAMYLNLDIEYPGFISLKEFKPSDTTEEISTIENKKGNNKVLNVFVYDKEGIYAPGVVYIGRVYYDVNHTETYSPDTYDFSFIENSSYVIADNLQKPFDTYRNQSFELLPYKARSIEIKGETKISSSTQYEAVITPEHTADKSVVWSVDDESIATVEDGIVTPLKNGMITLSATTTDGSALTAEINIEVADQPAVIDNIIVTPGLMVEAFSKNEYTYHIYVEKDCESISLKAEYQDGDLLCENYGEVISGIPKTIYLNSDVEEIKLTKSEECYNDTVYTLIVTKAELLELGDVDMNGKVTVMDVSAIQRSIVKIVEFDQLQTVLADVNGDKKVDILDATAVQRVVAKIVDSF